MVSSRTPGRPTRMRDIARLAKVSESTVSRALADSPLVAEATKARIRELAARHRYRVNASARNLRLRTSRTVAVVIPLDPETNQHISDPFFLDMLGCLADALIERDYDLLLSKTLEHGDSDYFGSGRADGLIVVGQAMQHERIRELAALGHPVVVWGVVERDREYCTVGSDNRLGARQATGHLLGLGRRRILFLGDGRLPEVAARLAGYLDAHRAAGVEPDPGRRVSCSFTSEAAAVALEQHLTESGADFDGIVAGSDVLAMSAIHVLHRHGLGVPDEVGVVGFDDIPAAAYYTPPLTTVRQRIDEGGRLMVRKLLAMIEGRPESSAVLPTELAVRRSCGG